MRTRAVIFDLDGTITEPYLDFDKIRREIGMPPDAGPILEAMERMPPDDRRRAEDVLRRHEAEAAEASVLNDGAREVLQWLDEKGIRTAVLTRNSRVSVERVLTRHGLRFDAVRTREDGAIKPSPEPVRALCRELGVDPSETWVVGDYLFDVQSGRQAGAKTVLLWPKPERPVWHTQADHVVRHLVELRRLIEPS